MKQGSIRIIAGKWRGRRLKVPEVKNLRPTPDRVRETLFNWLAPYLEGANCLDLFAGSGALGFEALSRGAAYAVMVDESIKVIELLHARQVILKADNVLIYRAKAPQQLRPVTERFDIVFLDPPYEGNLLLSCCRYLEENRFLAKMAHIYLEASQVIKDNELPPNWRIIKSGQAGQVFFHLARRMTESEKNNER